MTKATLITVLMIGLIGLALPVSALTVPEVMNYQGRLTDNTPGQDPINATVPMTFTIYDGPMSMVANWTETWGAVTVTDGIFSVLLGSNGSPIPESVFNTGSSRYLEIVVDGEVLSPRQQLGVVGYAMRAENSLTASTAYDVGCSGCVTSSNVLDSGLTTDDIAPNTLTAGDLATDSVGNSELNNAVNFDVNGLTSNAGGIYSFRAGGTSVYSDASGGSNDGYGYFGVGGFVGIYAEGNGGSGDVYGVYGRGVDTGTTSNGVYGSGGDYGVYGFGTTYGVYGQGNVYGVFAKGSTTAPYGLYADTDDNSGTSYGVISYANGSGGSAHYGGYFSASGATSNYGIYATGSTRAGYFNGEVYVSRNSTTTEPHIHLYEPANDYARIKFDNNQGAGYWDIAGITSATASAGWLRFYSEQYGNVLSLRADGYTYIHRLSSGYSNSLCTSTSTGGYLGLCSSSRRYKENIYDLKLGLETVMQMRPVTYRWIRDGLEDVGFVAEEISELAPILATYNEDQEPEGVRYRHLTAVLAKAIQQQQALIEELEQRLEKLEGN